MLYINHTSVKKKKQVQRKQYLLLPIADFVLVDMGLEFKSGLISELSSLVFSQLLEEMRVAPTWGLIANLWV